MHPNTKNRLHRLEILVVVSLFLVVSGLYFINRFDFSDVFGSSNMITGFVSSDVVTETVDLTIDQSQEYLLETTDSFQLTSLRLTGAIEGSGIVRIFFEDSSGQRLLVYTNVQEKKSGNLITGMAVADPQSVSIGLIPSEIKKPVEEALAGNQEIVSTPFYNECLETCFISVPFSPEKTNKLVFQLSRDAKLKISRLSYTIE